MTTEHLIRFYNYVNKTRKYGTLEMKAMSIKEIADKYIQMITFEEDIELFVRSMGGNDAINQNKSDEKTKA